MRRRLHFREDQFLNRAAQIGNLASASIPVLLDQLRREGTLKEGQRMLLVGTSAGYAQAGMIVSS
jgi:3-oxoacyl-[acyl-carrier-protein] synthase-3